MSGSALALVLIAAVCHATWNIAAKRVTSDGTVFVWCYATASALLWLPIGVILLARSPDPLSWSLLWAPVISGLVHFAYGVSLQTGYDRADLGVVYPVARGTGPLLTMIVAIAALSQRPGWAAVLGGLVVIGGVAVVATASTRATADSAEHAAAISRGRRVAGLRWGALTGAVIATYTLFDDHSVTALGLGAVSYYSISAFWQAVTMSPVAWRRRDRVAPVVRAYWREVAVIALLSPFAYVLVLQAMKTTSVALVAPVRESSIVVGSLLAWWLFKEPRPVRRLLGAAIVVVGIALIAVG
ncbi:MAG: DMT family transporter [Actinomycetota bacterium]|nr:DMT family transporter [Actinomycetota bacterium]